MNWGACSGVCTRRGVGGDGARQKVGANTELADRLSSTPALHCRVGWQRQAAGWWDLAATSCLLLGGW